MTDRPTTAAPPTVPTTLGRHEPTVHGTRPVAGPTRTLPSMSQPTRRLQLLYFPGCPNWQLADERLRDAASPLGLSIEHVLVTTTKAAERLSFRGSPTILIDGVDPFAAGDEPIGLSCRIYLTPDGYEGSPTTAQLAAVLAETG